MKMLLVLFLSTLFITSCGSKKKKTNSEEEGAKVEASKDAKDSNAAPGSNVTGDKVGCMMKSDKRDIQVKKEGNGCELIYSKFGNEEIVATSMNGTEHCQKIADRIQGNLENAGFKCE